MDKFLTEMETLFTVCLFMALPVRPERAGVGCRKNVKPAGYIPALHMFLSSEVYLYIQLFKHSKINFSKLLQNFAVGIINMSPANKVSLFTAIKIVSHLDQQTS